MRYWLRYRYRHDGTEVERSYSSDLHRQTMIAALTAYADILAQWTA
jgi:hypothetical protein